VVGWVQMRSYNPNFTKVFDGVSCKMMAVFPCRSGASQNPLNLRASRFENTCEKNSITADSSDASALLRGLEDCAG